MNCCVTVLLRYYGNATGCIGHVTKENPICHNMYVHLRLFLFTRGKIHDCNQCINQNGKI
jgi:hypothetical protein